MLRPPRGVAFLLKKSVYLYNPQYMKTQYGSKFGIPFAKQAVRWGPFIFPSVLMKKILKSKKQTFVLFLQPI